jgi:hypothetical protein
VRGEVSGDALVPHAKLPRPHLGRTLCLVKFSHSDSRLSVHQLCSVGSDQTGPARPGWPWGQLQRPHVCCVSEQNFLDIAGACVLRPDILELRKLTGSYSFLSDVP